MSAQTGVQTPRGPVSRRLGDRVKYRFARWQTEPNPLWMREMRQSARLMRTPLVLMVLTVMMTLLMATIGGMLTGSTMSPAETGSVLYHVFFSVAFAVVTWVGPALAANCIASEREGMTWEAVLLTGMRPQEIAQGKFLASYTAIAMYIVALAPVGAVPFLFGGITPLEVLLAFVYLFLFALLSVAFGLAISSKMTSLRVALLVTLLLSISISLVVYLVLGVVLSEGVHQLWSGVANGPPVWLPTAYERAPFGVEYLVYLIALPLAGIALPAWFLYEVTKANLTSVTDDRGFGLKRWFLVTSVVLTPLSAIPLFAVDPSDRSAGLIAGGIIFSLLFLFSAFLFTGEPIGPSRRVQAKLNQGAGQLRRWLAPGVTRAAKMQILCCLLGFAALGAAAVLLIQSTITPKASRQIKEVLVFLPYVAGFAVFVIGLAAYLRSRAKTAVVPRVLLLVLLFFICSGPWILAAIGGVLSGPTSSQDALLVAAPSPFFLIVSVASVSKSIPIEHAVLASMISATAYGMLGVLLLVLADRRCKKIIADHADILAEADRRLAEEDRLSAQAAAQREQAQLEQAARPPQAEPAWQDKPSGSEPPAEPLEEPSEKPSEPPEEPPEEPSEKPSEPPEEPPEDAP